MVFNLGKKNECVDCKLEPIPTGESVKLEYIQFRKYSVDKIADILKNGVKRENQDIIADTILCKKSEFDKLIDKRYKATFVGLADIGNNTVSAIEFVLGNIDISFDWRNVDINSDDVCISLANITVYPFGANSIKELDGK